MSLADIHGRLANTSLLFIAILAVWGLWRTIRKQGVSSSYWGALLIGEVLILLQGALGAYLWLVGERPDRSIHILYGIVSALVIPGVWAFTKGKQDEPASEELPEDQAERERLERRTMMVYAFALLFLFGILLRSVGTALVVGG
jgi:heme A synthase